MSWNKWFYKIWKRWFGVKNKNAPTAHPMQHILQYKSKR